VLGNPARVRGWVCYCGNKLALAASGEGRERTACAACGRSYQRAGNVVEDIDQARMEC